MTHRDPITEYDLIVVGAGILGSAAAKAFGQDGRRVLLLERDLSEPDRIVGELLQPGGVNALQTLGLEDCIEDIDGIPCRGYSVFRDGQWVDVPYPILETTNKQALGKSFHHGRFVQKLRQAATCVKNVTVKEATVTQLLKEKDGKTDQDQVIGVLAQTKDNEEVRYYAPLVIVADGLFSKFRKDVTVRTPDVRSHFVGFVMKDLDIPFPERGHVILASVAPILMYQIGIHDTRVLVDVPGKLPSASTGELKRYMQQVVAPDLPEPIQSKFLEALETERLRSMPNGFLPPTTNRCPGMILLGDAMNMRHPLTGGGMTVALNDVVLLRDLLSKDNIPSFTATDLIQQQLKSFHWQRKRYCAAINVLAMALYRLFAAANDPDLAVLQRGCFAYFQLGGDCVMKPVGLLSGLIQRPSVLVYHFFRVAFYAIYLEFKTAGWSNAPRSMIRLFTVLYTACVTIFPYLWSETRR
ncbi:squalene epoxidase-domain-containing protein [Radiomyces spectabilis]|uniref:squalene epoxidase-domain-containing protein n=1 Tax=Radiomyces spectabilis TaxID=64574 RepID=UPI00221F6B36|nr:squalene epoxidase-domain-containing protein [Radiomyces spectabilis]KAI8377498.1 squalene epoxidase-domain-containing protein [Radiomyces spectabilis]